MTNNILPVSKTVEYAAIALMMRHEDNRSLMSDLNEEHFGDPKSLTLFKAIKLIEKSKGRVNHETVIDQLRKMDDKTIMPEHVHAFANSPSHSDNIKSYKDSLEEKMLERRLCKAADAIRETSFKDIPFDQKVIQSASFLTTLTYSVAGQTKSATEAYDKALADVIYKQANPHSNMSWGLQALDDLHTGLYSGYHLVVAKPGRGKTSLVLKIGSQLAKTGFKTLMISSEMDATKLMYRELQRNFGIFSSNLKLGNVTNDEIELIKTYKPNENLWINDTPSMDIDKMVVMVELHKKKFGLDALIIDYLQILTTEKKLDENGQARYVSAQIRALQVRLDIPVIVLSQYNKESYNILKPTRNNIYGSSFLVNDANSITHINMAWKDNEMIAKNNMHPLFNIIEFMCDKSRDGVEGSVFAKWIPERTDIIDLPSGYVVDLDKIPEFEGDKKKFGKKS